ncbi:hypothetical protein ACN27J_09555 [Solwaraspora sp. WMMB762]|uniref:hypothetical protein n=1 Tax=Solwaraspora sp. WMMB762 TaxID=3404120 RepID=UPI003B9273E3
MVNESDKPNDSRPAADAPVRRRLTDNQLTAVISGAFAVLVAVVAGSFGLVGSVGSSETAQPSVSQVPTIRATESVSPDATPVVDGPLVAAVATVDNHCRQTWITDKSPAEIPNPSLGGIHDWVEALSAVHADSRGVTITVNATSEPQVVLRQIRAVVVGTREIPIPGTQIGIGCGEAISYRYISANLDVEPPAMTSATFGEAEDESGVSLTPIRFPYEVDTSDAESFYIEAQTSRFDVYWEIEIDWSWNGRTGTIRVDDNGQPFRVSAAGNVTARCYWSETGVKIDSFSESCDL